MDKLITIQELSGLIGLSVPGLYGLSHRRQIPVVRLSPRCIRFKLADIEAWLQSKSTPATTPKEAKVRFKKSLGRPHKNTGAKSYANLIVDQARMALG